MAADAAVTIRLDLDTEEGREAMDVFLSAGELLHAVRTVDQWLRNQVKYGTRSEEATTALQEARDILRAEIPSRLQERL